MTLKQSLFVSSYIASGGNAAAAARFAGYRGSPHTLEVVGAENLRKPEIADEIRRRTEHAAASADEVLSILTDHARGDISDVLDGNGVPSIGVARKRRVTRSIRKYKSITTSRRIGTETETETKVEVELYDAQAAAVQLGRYHGLFVDRMVSEKLTAEFTQRVAQVVLSTINEFVVDEDTRAAFIDAVDSRISALAGAALMAQEEPDESGRSQPFTPSQNLN